MATIKTGAVNGSVGLVTDVHTAAQGALNSLGLVVPGTDAFGYAEFIYLSGCASTIVGSVVLYNKFTGTTSLIIADGLGAVAVAMGINNLTTTFGWYCIVGCPLVDVVANSAVSVGGKCPGRETTDGKVGDGRAAGDEINNFFQLVATTAAALVNCQIDHPFVNNFTGA